MITHTHHGRRLLAVVGAIALSASGVIGLHSAAQAAEVIPPGAGNVNPNVTSKSIIIHKHRAVKDAPTLNPGAPPATDSGIGEPIENAGFTVKGISGIDLTSPAGWTKLDGVEASPTEACDIQSADPTVTLGDSLGQKFTNDEGVATFEPPTIGAYLVCETTLPANASMSAAPFIVTVPTPYKGDWVYNVHVFPKNTINAVDKVVVAPDGLAVGSTLSYEVSTKVSPLPAPQVYSSFIITDTLDSRLRDVKVASVKLGTQILTLGDGTTGDYMVRSEPNSNKRTVLMNPVVLNNPASFGKELTVTFSGVVDRLGDGDINNTAHLFVNDPNMEHEGIPSRTSESHWRDLTIRKVDKDKPAAGLSRAVFEVYNSADPYEANCTKTTTSGEAIARFNESTFETRESGEVVVGGLYVTSDREAGNADAGHRCYVLKEIEAPAGYIKPEGQAALTPVKLTRRDGANVSVTVVNTQRTVPELPLTGAVGQAALILGGLALAGGGAAAAVLRRRKNAA